MSPTLNRSSFAEVADVTPQDFSESTKELIRQREEILDALVIRFGEAQARRSPELRELDGMIAYAVKRETSHQLVEV